MDTEPTRHYPGTSTGRSRPAAAAEPPFEAKRRSRRSPETIRVYRGLVRACASHFEAKGLTLAELSPADFVDYLDAHTDKASTKRSILAALRAHYAAGPVHPNGDPTRGIRYARPRRSLTSPIGAEDAARLLESIDASGPGGLRDVCILRLLMTGLAVEAITQLNIDDVCREDETTLQLRSLDLVLSPELAETLERYLCLANLVGESSGPLFRTIPGKAAVVKSNRISYNDISRLIKKRTDAIGLKSVTARNLRAMALG